jgi:hypothetical protein
VFPSGAVVPRDPGLSGPEDPQIPADAGPTLTHPRSEMLLLGLRRGFATAFDLKAAAERP